VCDISIVEQYKACCPCHFYYRQLCYPCHFIFSSELDMSVLLTSFKFGRLSDATDPTVARSEDATWVRRLALRDIRNFGDDSEDALIRFPCTLTLILSPNSTRKMTIIEALKYVTTGKFPPDSKVIMEISVTGTNIDEIMLNRRVFAWNERIWQKKALLYFAKRDINR